jgi:hypothetical protein
MNQVRTLYQNEDITAALHQIYVWTNNDPYTATASDPLLQEFRDYRTSISGDLGMLLTFKNTGGRAHRNGLCNSNTKYKLGVAGIYTWYSNFTTYSWSVYVITHELGHLFGSAHTHACAWNGNNTAIDGCAPVEKPDGSSGGECALPAVPSGGGTIMSYCHNNAVGINFNLGFGTQPGNVIRNSVQNANCLSFAAISGADCFCNSSYATVTALSPPSGYTWTYSSNLTPGTTSGNSRTFTKNTSSDWASGWIALNLGSTELVRKDAWLGIPYDIPSQHSVSVQYNTSKTITPSLTAYRQKMGITSFYWVWSQNTGNATLKSYGLYATVTVSTNGTYVLHAYGINDCGGNTTGAPMFIYNISASSSSSAYSMSAYPNPVSSALNVEIEEEASLESASSRVSGSSAVYTIRLYNITGTLALQTTASGSATVQLHVGSLPSGIYKLYVYDGTENPPLTQTIVISH